MLVQTNTIYQENDPTKPKQKSSGGNKWINLVSPVWDRIKPKKEKKKKKKRQEDPIPGSGLTILPNDPHALIERFDLLLASQNAGHTGVRNELVSIFDELKRQGVINTNTYKKLNSIIKK